MTTDETPFVKPTPEAIEAARPYVEMWAKAGPALEKIRNEELRNLDVQKAIALLCGPADYTKPPYAPQPTSGLIEMQRLFKLLRKP